jgi:hypothetical protein
LFSIAEVSPALSTLAAPSAIQTHLYWCARYSNHLKEPLLVRNKLIDACRENIV